MGAKIKRGKKSHGGRGACSYCGKVHSKKRNPSCGGHGVRKADNA